MRRFFKGVLLILGGLFGLLLAAIMILPLVWPLPAQAAGDDPRSFALPDSRFMDLDGLTVHVRSQGEGAPALVMLHGFLSNTRSWDRITPALATDHRVVAYDRPSFGLTDRPLPGDWPTGRNPYTPDAQVRQLLALLDAEGIDRAVLVGNSAGGTVAVNFALQHPDRVAGLVLISPAIYAGGGAPDWIKPLLFSPQLERIGPVLVNGFIESLASSDIGFTGAWYDPSRVTDADRAAYYAPARIGNAGRALWEFTKASADLRLGEKVAALAVPTLVITGQFDAVVPTEQSIRLAGELPGAALAVLPDCGHVPQEECPGLVLEAMQPFLASLERRP